MTSLHAIPSHADDNPASPAPARSDCRKLIIGRCISFARYIGFLMVIFLAIPAGMPPELKLNPGSSLWSLNISASHSKLVTVEYPHMKLLFSFDGQLALSRASLVSPFAQGPGCTTSVRANVQSSLAIAADLGMNGLVNALSGGEVTIDEAARAKWSLQLGPWWVAVLVVDVSFTGSNFTAPSDSGDGGDQMILGGTLSTLILVETGSLLCVHLGASLAEGRFLSVAYLLWQILHML